MSSLFSFNTGAFSTTITISDSDPVPTIQANINAAIAAGATTITVTGSKITANIILTLNIPAGVTVVWNAVYKGTANPVIDYYGAGTLNISGPSGWVQNTSSSGSVTAIRANGDSLIVSGGTVQSGRGRAIEGAGANTVISVTGGNVFNEATSNLFPVIDMDNASNTGVNVIVSGGNVFAASVGASAYGYVIQSYGNIAISGGTLSTSGTYGRVINLVGPNSNVTVSGGTLEATGSGGTAISSSTTLPDASIVNTSVTITGGFVASYATSGTGWAIHTTGSNSSVSISGGAVFAYGNSITGSSNSVIYTERNAGGFLVPTGNGVVIAWNRPAWVAGGQNVYFTGATTDIITSPAGATATWGKRNLSANIPFDGISYSFGGNTGFIQLQDVTVVDPTYPVTIMFGYGGFGVGNSITSTGAGGSFTIVASQTINVPYNQSQSFTVTSASDYYISAIDTWYPPDGSQYFSQLLYANTTPTLGETYNFSINNVVRSQVIRVFFTQDSATQYNIIAFADVGGSISSPGFNTVNPGTNRTFNVTAQAGYVISGVVVDGNPVSWGGGSQSGSYTFSSISRNSVITATFERTNLNITATAGPGGSISPQGNVSVPYGDDRIFTITPDAGYFINEVLIDGVPALTTSEQEFLEVSTNHTISVTFAANEKTGLYCLSVISGVGGSVSGTESGYYSEGYAVAVAAVADCDFHFTEWTITGAEITDGVHAKPATFNMPANSVVLTANFEPIPHGTFTLNVIGAVGGTLSGTRSGPYPDGYAVEVTATARAGYRFVGWTITGAEITGGNNANPAQFSMPENTVTLIAIFEQIRPGGSPQTGINGNITLPIVMLALGLFIITGAELYRRGLFRKSKQK